MPIPLSSLHPLSLLFPHDHIRKWGQEDLSCCELLDRCINSWATLIFCLISNVFLIFILYSCMKLGSMPSCPQMTSGACYLNFKPSALDVSFSLIFLWVLSLQLCWFIRFNHDEANVWCVMNIIKCDFLEKKIWAKMFLH
jgi:hypothetical protein